MIADGIFANIINRNTLDLALHGDLIFEIEKIRVFEGERELSILSRKELWMTDALTEGWVRVIRIELAEDMEINGKYRVNVLGLGDFVAVPYGIFDTEYFKESYLYEGDDLGANICGDKTTFKLWAPVASAVSLKLFTEGEGGEAYSTIPMTRGDRGVWQTTADCGHGTYYTYAVTNAVGTQEAVDPYAKAAGVNGGRGMVVDLSRTNPDGWDADKALSHINNYSEATIWEVHVRDFSNMIENSKYKGKYLAFTEGGLKNEHGEPVGIDYLKALGISHVHLLPVYDYASVDEHTCENFNWGYDPQNYNVPEGSYSTDPYHGEVRIKEYKEMVAALHEAGIGVIMDMVYNHTYDANSNLNKVVPYYYYRYDIFGKNTNASGCGNDTASERFMFGKYMVDSCAYWVREYHLDGLRFDLMGLHDLATMQKVEAAVHEINPRAIIYGEGWDMGATIGEVRQANQKFISEITPTGEAIGSVAVFNDVIRDGLKGSVFEEEVPGYINGGADAKSWASVWFGIMGGAISGDNGWSVQDSMVINYMSAHDNYSLWDKLALANPEDSLEARAEMNKLGAAILMISKGTPFWQAGEEMLRTKDGDENSYKSSDKINNMDWSTLCPGTIQHDTMLYYKGLIEMRRGLDIFTNSNVTIAPQSLANRAVILTFTDELGGKAKVIINPRMKDFHISLGEEWNLIANEQKAGSTVIARESSATVRAVSMRVYVNDALLEKQDIL